MSAALTCFFQPEPVVAAPEPPPPALEPEPILPPQPVAVEAPEPEPEPEPVPAQPEVLRHVACLACLYAAAWGSQSSVATPLASLSCPSSHSLLIYVITHLPSVCILVLARRTVAKAGMTLVSSCMSKRRGV